jgi:hypothetical protein
MDMERYPQPRIGPDRRARDRRAKRPEPGPASPRAAAPRVRWPIVLAALGALAGVAFIQWTRSAAGGTPLDRAETLCREVAGSPRDSLAAGMVPGVEFRRRRFDAATPPARALEQALGLDSTRILKHWTQRVGDYDVAAMWVRLPGDDRHALVVGWIEGPGLAICRFRFPGRGAALSGDEIERGDDLLDRVLVPRNFRARG